ncbi:MAG: desaturase [Betaproteobacteria bacterium RIFCSPLOWO2_12_FULL_62_58]|nr:MAG: desaturase [Betaproteobacteria bacterium RIFCSPLOWO2_12_FULL_62_58]
MKVAVIGGGYAGMAAAVTLADQGVPVTVYEAAKQLGGRARRVEVRGLALDNGLHILLGAYRETLRLIGHVNPDGGGALLRLPLDWVIYQQFRLRAVALPAPLHLVVGLLQARGISLTDRLSALRFIIRMRLRDYALARDVTVNELLDRFGQSARLRRMLWHPLCVAALNTPPDKASGRVFLRVLRDSLGAARDHCDLLLPKTDLTSLFPEPAAAHVKARGGTVRIGCRVTAIDPCDAGFSVSVGGRQEVFSHVICALPPHQVNAFLIGISALAEIAEIIESFSYQPIYSVYLRYPRSIRLPAPMVGFDSTLLHWAFDRELLCGQTGVIGIVISAEGAHQQLSQDELARLVHRELQQHIAPLPDPLWAQVIAEKRATFSCTPALARPSQQTPVKNFFLAGDYTERDYPATLEAAVRSGIGAARLVLEKRD